MNPKCKAFTFLLYCKILSCRPTPATVSSLWRFSSSQLWIHSFSWHIISSIKYRPTESRFHPPVKQKIALLLSPGKADLCRCAQASLQITGLAICPSSHPAFSHDQACLDFADLESRWLLWWLCILFPSKINNLVFGCGEFNFFDFLKTWEPLWLLLSQFPHPINHKLY